MVRATHLMNAASHTHTPFKPCPNSSSIKPIVSVPARWSWGLLNPLHLHFPVKQRWLNLLYLTSQTWWFTPVDIAFGHGYMRHCLEKQKSNDMYCQVRWHGSDPQNSRGGGKEWTLADCPLNFLHMHATAQECTHVRAHTQHTHTTPSKCFFKRRKTSLMNISLNSGHLILD